MPVIALESTCGRWRSPFPACASRSPNCGWPTHVVLYAERLCASKSNPCAPPIIMLLCAPRRGQGCLLVSFFPKKDAQKRGERANRSFLPLFCMLLGFFFSHGLSFPSWNSSRKLREEEVIDDNLFLSQFPG